MEVALFEFGMKLTPKQFNTIHKQMLEKGITGKSVTDVIHFFWYWKSTSDYKTWLKKDFASVEGAANFRIGDFEQKNELGTENIGEVGSMGRTSRLRKRQKVVDYTYSNVPLVRDRSPTKTPEKKRSGPPRREKLSSSASSASSMTSSATKAPKSKTTKTTKSTKSTKSRKTTEKETKKKKKGTYDLASYQQFNTAGLVVMDISVCVGFQLRENKQIA